MKEIFGKFLLLLIALTVFHVQVAEANVTLGVVGCDNRVGFTNMDGEKLNYVYIVNDLLMDALEVPGVELMDISPEALRARVDETYFQNLDLGKTEAAADFERHPDYLVYGYLTHFSVQHRESGIGKNYITRADLSIRILETNTGKCIFVATGKGEANSRQYRLGGTLRFGAEEVSDECLHAALVKAVDEIGAKYRKKFG